MRTEHPDLILLDANLPTMTGIEFLEIVAHDSALSGTPVIVFENSDQAVDVEKCKELGARAVLSKGEFSPDALVAAAISVIGPAPAAPIPFAGDIVGAPKEPAHVKILIAEDEQILAELSAVRFRAEGFQVFTAGDGQQCLEVAARERPDIILLDVIMPVMNGFEALKLMKADPSLSSIPVVIFSNLAQEKEIAEGKRLGAIDFFVKAKMTPTEYVERVKAILGLR
jgi:CheY-like chemotaxis protein